MMLARDLMTLLEAAHEEVREPVADVTRAIYERPELSLEEFHAHDVLTSTLERGGFDIAKVDGLSTAFVATLDSGKPGPEIGLLAEYDALPEIGHACGHHLIAGSAVSAGLSLRSVLHTLGGSVKVFGCPAEETGVGKIAMLRAGVFNSTSAALTFHAYHSSTVMTSCNGVRQSSIDFTGKAAHAAASPWDGASALDGVLLTFQNVAALRQFVLDGSRIHGIITDGGSAVNVIPERASCVVAVRSTDSGELELLHQRVRECAEGAARATGTQVVVRQVAATDPVRKSILVDSIVRDSFDLIGEQVADWPALASTDFGNVSQVVPSALFSVATWPSNVAFHSREATELSGTVTAFDAMSRGSKIMAIAGAELLASGASLTQEWERYA